MKKTSIRVVAVLIVAILVLTLFYSAAVMIAHAADGDVTTYTAKIITGDTTVSRTLTVGKVATGLTVKFNFLIPDPDVVDLGEEYSFEADELTMPTDSSFGWSGRTTLEIKKSKKGNYYEATLKYVSYNGSGTGPLQLTLLYHDFNISVPIPGKYFKEGDTTDGAPTSDIVVQSTVVTNADGQTLDSVNEKSGPLKVEVIFYDIGLRDEGNISIDAAKKYAFITSTTGFRLHNGSSGIVERVSSSSQYPRFKATFEGVESTGSGNTLSFRVLYDFEEYEASISGEATATLFQVKTEDEDDDEIAPLRPNIIIQEYSYGKESVVAGEEFELDLSFRNTSAAVGVENVVMTIEPSNGFTITSASNTVYFPGLAPGETMHYSVAMRANPAGDSSIAASTEYNVNVKFTYQYLSKKEYAAGDSGVVIAIPVTQLDRFGVDEITDYSQYLSLGEEGYVTVPITNKGKSSTYNITGTVKCDMDVEFVAAPVHFGNLEAGKSGSIDISITINTPGIFEADAIVTYEDENMNQKELSVPFAIMVMEPTPPNMEMPPDMQGGEIAPEGPGLPSIIFCSAGALLMAVPLALYLIKRVKAKGSEDLDEDF